MRPSSLRAATPRVWDMTDDDRATLPAARRAAAVLRAKRWRGMVPGRYEDFVGMVHASLDGDAEAALDAIVRLNNPGRGDFAVAVCLAGAPAAVRRQVLSAAWDHDHRHLIAACGGVGSLLRRLFRDAAFDVPGTEAKLRVFRGTSALTFEEARAGFAWTTSRDVACWFAMRFADRNGVPLVLATEVPRESAVYFSDARRESEVLLEAEPLVVAVDGDAAEWAEAHRRFEAAKGASHATA